MLCLLILIIIFLWLLSTHTYRWLHGVYMKRRYKRYLRTDAQKIILHSYAFQKCLNSCPVSGNYYLENTGLAATNLDAFDRMIGYHREKLWETFLPNTWLKFLINLPLTVSKKLGVPIEKALSFLFYTVYALLLVLDIHGTVLPLLTKLIELIR